MICKSQLLYLVSLLEGKSEQDQTRLDQEVIVYYVRKLETEQLQKMQMQNQVDRMQEQVSRLLSDKEFLRAQLKLQARVPTFPVPTFSSTLFL